MIQERLEREEEMVSELLTLFRAGDMDDDHYISRDEFTKLMTEESVLDTLANLGVHPTEAQGLFTLLDNDASGYIQMDEFIDGCVRVTGEAKAVDIVTLMYENKKTIMKLEQLRKMLEVIVD